MRCPTGQLRRRCPDRNPRKETKVVHLRTVSTKGPGRVKGGGDWGRRNVLRVLRRRGKRSRGPGVKGFGLKLHLGSEGSRRRTVRGPIPGNVNSSRRRRVTH